jgi:hypothetical protein
MFAQSANTSARSERLWYALAAATIFLAAFLLFQVELLIAKPILPWFGGSASVWLACLLFFQVALLCGYAYAHLLAKYVPARQQGLVHGALLAVSLIFLPIVPSEFWKPSGGEDPLPLILGLLAATIGLPFLLLSSTTPLLQAWLARAGAQSVYRYYALSNLASMLALVSYPLLVEPFLTVRAQALLWSAGYAVFALTSAALAWRWRKFSSPVLTGEVRPKGGEGARIADRLLWVLLPAAASALLLALSNHVLRNVAAVPLFWMIPLALYLLSFVVAFDRPRWYRRRLWLPAAAAVYVWLCYLVAGLWFVSDLTLLLGAYALCLFVLCMVCHGELARLKPHTSSLTAYYLAIAAGGALGGFSVSVLAPMLLDGDFDLAILLPVTALLVIAAFALASARQVHWITGLGLAAALAVTAYGAKILSDWTTIEHIGVVHLERNFYGPLRVEDAGATRILYNGAIIHGREYSSPGLYFEPTSYYSRGSGVGIALTELGMRGPLRVATIGLGSGAISAYWREGDTFRFYEINPAVAGIAREYFQYLPRCGDACEVVLGDARLSLEREEPQGYDLLAVDAFSSDSVPAHLLTREAFALYWRHIKPGGVLAVHATNRYINLSPIIALAAEREGYTARALFNPSDDVATDYAEWILITKDPSFFDAPIFFLGQRIAIPEGLREWTDDYSNLWRSMRPTMR